MLVIAAERALAIQVMGATGYPMGHELQLHSRRGTVIELSYGGLALHDERAGAAIRLG